MNDERESLLAVVHEHSEKLLGLSTEELLAAARTNAPLIVMAANSRDLSEEGATLLLSGEGRSVWLVAAEMSWLVAWLPEDGILAIASDQLPEVHLTAQSTLQARTPGPGS